MGVPGWKRPFFFEFCVLYNQYWDGIFNSILKIEAIIHYIGEIPLEFQNSVSFLRNAVENFDKLEFFVAADDEQSDIEDVIETRESP